LVLESFEYQRNRTREAEKSFNEALEIIRASNVPFDTSVLLNNLGAVYLHQHKFKPAEDVLMWALQIKEADKSSVDRDLTPELNMLGAVYMATGKFAEAEHSTAVRSKSWSRDARTLTRRLRVCCILSARHTRS
jgi:tetratricopeptide (TPR) repeat protein